MLESEVEFVLKSTIKKKGGLCIKMLPTITGLPDRLILMPGGRHHFVELKRTNGKVSKVQKVWFKRLERLGHPVTVLYGTEDVRRFCDLLPN
jgi:hypothetical protein